MKVTGKTKVVGIFGYPVSHTLSPLMQNTAFEEVGLDFIYLPFLVRPEDLERATKAISALGMVGVNVTIPHKERIINYLDEVSPEVEQIGAVNTVVNREGRLTGYNTDGQGFIRSLEEQGFSLQGKQVLLLGAGGAALSIACALLNKEIKRLVLINRTYSRAYNLIQKLQKIAPASTKLEFFEFEERNTFPQRKNINYLINATSLGLDEQDEAPVDLNCFPLSMHVYDLIYHRKTKLLQEAEKRGMSYQSGVDMLVFQGALSFKIWTGKEAPIAKMKKIVKDYLSKR